MPNPSPRHRFSHADRLHGARMFSAVFDAKLRKNVGPLTVFTMPNGLGHHRLGLSVSRRVGKAVVRSRAKRMLREAFRLTRHGWPGGYDVVVVVRPHTPATLGDYQRMMTTAVTSAHLAWQRRDRQQQEPAE